MIKIVCTRLLHVTMTTLHNYMGLSSELLKPVEFSHFYENKLINLILYF